MKIAYFDCFSGAGGDMIAAAMLDAGLDGDYLVSMLKTLGIKDLEIKITKTQRNGISATRFEPIAPQEHHHRNLPIITNIINDCGLSDTVKQRAIAIFTTLAEAEAAVHGKNIDEIHFHEVGAVDSIVDIISASLGLEALAIERVYCSTLSVGSGTVTCEHGTLPVPAPATAEILKDIPVQAGPAQGELLTPTAAAVLATIVDEFCPLPQMKIDSIGYGAGSRKLDNIPNALRLIIGSSAEENTADVDCVCLIEANIDDATGERIGQVSDTLFQKGALDVFTTPIYMKQNRPAVQLSVITKPADAASVEHTLFAHGLTLGLRRQIIQRSKLPRQFITVKTKYGDITVKLGLLEGKIVSAKPEFAQCSAAAKAHNVPVQTVIDAVAKDTQKHLP